MDTALSHLKEKLAVAQEQAKNYLSGDALPVGNDVLAIVDKDIRPWWESLSPSEAFFLFEISPRTAARAPIDVRARAYCAGVGIVSAEWWGTPGSPNTEPAARLVAIGRPAAACLVPLFDDDHRTLYKDGETRSDAKANAWTLGDIAAGLAARIVGEIYDASASPADRAARRAGLRAKL
jgi:hypothetical protein